MLNIDADGTATFQGHYPLEAFVLGTDHCENELRVNSDRFPEASDALTGRSCSDSRTGALRRSRHHRG